MSSLRDAVIVLGGLALAMVLYACGAPPARDPETSPLATPAAAIEVSPLATPGVNVVITAAVNELGNE